MFYNVFIAEYIWSLRPPMKQWSPYNFPLMCTIDLHQRSKKLNRNTTITIKKKIPLCQKQIVMPQALSDEVTCQYVNVLNKNKTENQ